MAGVDNPAGSKGLEEETPCGCLLLAVRLVASAGDKFEAETTFIAIAREIAEALPSHKHLVATISQHVVLCEYEAAQERCQDLLAYESLLFAHARGLEARTAAA